MGFLGKAVSLCPTSRPNLPDTPAISQHPTFVFQSPMMKRTSILLVLVLGGHVGLHRIVQLHLLQQNCDVEWFAMKMNRDQSVIFEIVPKYCILDSFVNYEDYSIPSKGFLLTVVK